MPITDVFQGASKVVISPDQMRAWIMLEPPPKGQAYTPEAIAAWLPLHNVVYGADENMIQKAASSGRYQELLEVARGKEPVAAAGGSYTLNVEKKPFTGLRGNPDGSLFYDDLSFLQEVQAGTVLADIHPARPGAPGKSVTGEEIPPPESQNGKTLEGSGFELSADGTKALAPALSHVSVLNDQLVVTPLMKVDEVAGPLHFEGNILVEGDLRPGAEINATGSVFVQGRADAANVQAGRNVLLCKGMRAQTGFGNVEARENVWGLVFESANIKAGGDICANQLVGCEATAGKRALILGGRGMIANTNLFAKEGVVATVLGDPRKVQTTVGAGLDAAFIEGYESLEKRLGKLNADIQVLVKNIYAFERVNKMKADKGRGDPSYKEMIKKRDQMLSVMNIVEAERTRQKRVIDSFSGVAVIARESAYPGLVVSIDARTIEITRVIPRVKFKRKGDVLEVTASGDSR